MKTPSIHTLIIFVTLFISSCSNATPSPTSTIVPASETPANSILDCPITGTPSEVHMPENLYDFTSGETLSDTIIKYLNEGGNPEGLPETFLSRAPTKLKLSLQMIPLDLNRDNINELLVEVNHALSDYPYNASSLVIFSCHSGLYQEVGNFASDEIVSIEDLNRDTNPEIVIHWSWYGSGCLEFYEIAGWNSKAPKVIGYLDPQTSSGKGFPCGTELHIQDLDHDGQKELTFTGWEQVRHSGLPERRFVQLYEISDMQTYRAVSKKYMTSPSRVYVLADAQKALDEYPSGPYSKAIYLYERAANDKSLQDHPSADYSINKTDEQSYTTEYTTAFALFRLVTIYGGGSWLYRDELQATNTIESLSQRFPKGTPGSEFVEIAKLFMNEQKAGKSPSISCSVVSLHIDQEYPNLEQELQWPGVLDYDNGTICPY